MKRIFTLLVSAGLFSSAFAQQKGYDENDRKYDKRKDVVVLDKRNNQSNDRFNKYSYLNKQQEKEISIINREYDNRVLEVQRKPFMSRNKKSRLVAQLEDQRRYELRKVYLKFNSSRSQSYERKNDRRI